jgi:putative CocE/NonD family hydrolase
MRARYRRSWEHPQPLEPGAVAEMTVAAFPTSNLFKAGHRIRVDIASSNFPHSDINPNTGGSEGGGDPPRIARNSLFMDPSRPSRIMLPIVPTRA